MYITNNYVYADKIVEISMGNSNFLNHFSFPYKNYKNYDFWSEYIELFFPLKTISWFNKCVVYVID